MSVGRDPEDYLVGGSDADTADMTTDASLLGYLQLSDDSSTFTGHLRELKTPWKNTDEEA